MKLINILKTYDKKRIFMEKEPTIERTNLLNEFSKRNLSQVCLMQIAKAIKFSKDSELAAKKIVALLDEKEKDLIKNLQNIINIETIR